GQSQPGPPNAPTTLISLSLEELKSRFNKIEKEFYSGAWSKFIEDYVAGEIKLPVTDGAIPGFPRVWRRNDPQKDLTTKPSLLFVDSPISDGSNSLATEFLTEISSNNTSFYPIFGASGCGKTRTVIDMLSQQWGFYFSGGENDRGSADVDTLHSIITPKIGADMLKNNSIAKSLTACLILARLSILSRCLSTPGGNLTPKQWMMLQVCPQVFGEVYLKSLKSDNLGSDNLELSMEDLFLALFKIIANLFGNIDFPSLQDLMQYQFLKLKKVIPTQHLGGLKFLLVLDEAQRLGSSFEGRFQSEGKGIRVARSILSPFYHGMESLTGDPSQRCIVFCGTGFCIYDLDWVWGTGEVSKDVESVLKDPRFKRNTPFPRWECRADMEAYVGTLISYLDDQGLSASAANLKSLLDEQGLAILFAQLHGRLRPAISVIETVIQRGEPGPWKELIGNQVKGLVDPLYKISGNLCFELSRVLDHVGKKDADIREKIRDAVKGRLLYYNDFELEYSESVLVEASFARFKEVKINGNTKNHTIIDEPVAFQAAINFLNESDHGLIQLLSKPFKEKVPRGFHGTYMDFFSPTLLIPIFHREKLNPKLFKATNDHIKSKMALTPRKLQKDKTYSIVGCDEGIQGISHDCKNMTLSMSQFLFAHCNNNSLFNDMFVPPFYFPIHTPSGPDVVFVLESEGQHYPVFVQSKVSKKKGLAAAHRTISYDAIKRHLSLDLPANQHSLADFCSNDIFISLLLISYREQHSYAVAKPNVVSDSSNNKELTQHTLIIDRDNIGNLVSENLAKILEIRSDGEESREPKRGRRSKEPASDSQATEAEDDGEKSNRPKRRKVSMESVSDSHTSEDEEEVNKPSGSKSKSTRMRRKPTDMANSIDEDDEGKPSETMKRKVPKKLAIAIRATKGSKITKSGRSEKRRTSERLASAVLVMEDEGDTNKARGPNKRSAVESIQAMKEDKPNGPRQSMKSRKSK
ncbi:hypothetical protein BGZ76_004039, partial [Entomortierella beljakovae]